MPVEHSITKKRGPESPHGFAALRKEGIRLIQEMAGDVWTDYNLHDPGVTILEHLCYALTDLIYRSDFPVEDLLTGDNGRIAFDQQALHLPEKILPCRPSTVADYRQLILDRCPDVEDVWFTIAPDTDSQSVCPGIYKAAVRLADDVEGAHKDPLLARVKQKFVEKRNLCEDIHDSIVVSKNIDCRLIGTIEVDGSVDNDIVLAEVYWRAVSYIASRIYVRPLKTAGADGDTLIDRFTGPLTSGGRIRTDDHGDTVILSHLIGMLLEIDGIVRVQDLSIKVMRSDGPSVHRESVARRDDEGPLWLLVPRPDSPNVASDENIRLLKNGKLITASVAGIWHKFQQMVTADKSARRARSGSTTPYILPRGEKRDFRRYHSIQNHFPNAYGINHDGVPSSAPEETKAQAKQLKAYLMIFEQILANHLSNVDGIHELFSNAGHPGRTYRYQVLNDKTISDANLHKSDPEKSLERVMAEFDDRSERKSRQLDHMLAVFGESHSQKTLRHFNYYSPSHDPNEAIAKNKAAYLSNIVEVTRDRIAGLNYLEPKSVAGFAQRVGLLLGFQRHGVNLTDAIVKAGMNPRSSDTKASGSLPAGRAITTDTRYRPVPTMSLDTKSAARALQYAQHILKKSIHGQHLLAHGAVLDRYRLGPVSNSNRAALILGDGSGGSWQTLATFADADQASKVANSLQNCLIELCRASEGMHVVEHILLRPAAGADEHAGRPPCTKGTALWREFYPLRFSVFFPGWTVRCSDRDFRLLAEETVRINSPAHVFGQCFWLDYPQMQKFEALADDWANTRRLSGTSPADIDDCAVRLIDFVTLMPREHQ